MLGTEQVEGQVLDGADRRSEFKELQLIGAVVCRLNAESMAGEMVAFAMIEATTTARVPQRHD